jgi:2-polyprenyl-3-methyl-5-hydroxy-6-metoxy-1,4-benzoquinol methylase
MKKLAEWTHGGLHDALLDSLPDLEKELPIVDIGCGTGAWLERLTNLGFINLYGIDLDPNCFEASQATFLRANIDDDCLDFKDQKFSLISAIEVVEHLENPGHLFSFVEKNLMDDGYFLMTTPNIHSLSCRLRFFLTGNLASFDSKGNQTHIYPVLLDALERVLPRYSLKIDRLWGYPASGSVIFRKSTLLSAHLAKLFSIPDKIPGYTLCLLIKRELDKAI